MSMDRFQREALDRHITGNYGEDQFSDPDPRIAIVYWTDGVAQEVTYAVTGDYDDLTNGLNGLVRSGSESNRFWMKWMMIGSEQPLTIDPTVTIEEFLALDWGSPEPDPEPDYDAETDS